MNRIIFLLATLCPLLAFAAAPTKPFELRDGDRVVFLGDTLMEREKDYGYIELMMTLRFPERNVTFRNLGWSADTPVGISRVSFDWPKGEGEMFRVLMEQVRQVQPTVVVLGYGMASSFDGDAGLEKFKTDYNKLIDAILELNKETRFILLSPIRHEKLPAPLPDPARHNEMLAGYVKAIQGVAEKRGYHFINLFELMPKEQKPQSIFSSSGPAPECTENGIHLNQHGYQFVMGRIAESLWFDQFNVNGPLPIWFPARGYASPLYEELRHTIIAKNQLFFHRWRPENSTYLFLFRKHEQGKNAQEIPKFDPLIEAEEKKIATLRTEPSKFVRSVKFSGPDRKKLIATSSEGVVRELTYPIPSGLKPNQNPLPDKPATPRKEQPHPTFQLADPNLEVTLWAENPLLAKPIAMNWDARGRLWIASSSVYPQIEPGQAQDDKILILEDTDGDGKADKTTVFADGLLIPTGIEPGDGGCYVGQSTELLHFKDTDGDGIADQRRVVLSGFGTEDTHHILHTLRWGPDGQLYMNQSIYIHTHTETPHGVVRLNSGGTLALRPDTMELGVTMKGLVNGWGHVWDDFGQEFQTDGAGGAPPNGLFWNIPQAMFTTYEGARRILGSISPGSYPKFCGLELIKSERFPKEWQGNAVTLDFRANRIVRFEITEQGAGYTSKQYEFLRSTNVTFRPIDVKLGPDGALYIADWSNPIIQHGEVDFRDPRRDREHGRIWRVGYKGGKDVKAPELANVDQDLMRKLDSPNGWTQKQARRVLLERVRSDSKTAEAIKALFPLTFGMPPEKRNLETLWFFQAADWIDMEKLLPLLQSKDHQLRSAAVRVLGVWAGDTPGIPTLAGSRIDSTKAQELLATVVQDDHPRVRIEALRALARIPTARSAELALSVLDKGQVEGFLEYALWLTINDLAEPWAAAVESGAWKIEGREKQLQYALKAMEPKLATRLMTKVVGDKPIPRDGSGGMIELIGQAGGPDQLRKLFDQVLAKDFTDEAMTRALNQLGEAARLRNAKPSGELSAIVARFFEGRQAQIPVVEILTIVEAPGATPDTTPDPKVTITTLQAAVKLAGIWKLASASPALTRFATNSFVWPDVRYAAIEGLRDLGGRNSIDTLRTLAKDKDATIQRSAAAALATTDLNGSMPQILEVVSATAKEDDALALWRSLLSAKGSAAAFATAVGKTTLPEPAARAGVRAAREGGRNEPNLVLALNRAGGLSDASAALNDDEIHTIAYSVTRGDPANGEKIYRNKQLGCVLCHAIGGAGGKVGPDITSLGASTPLADYIVEAVLLPNKKVKEGFNSVQISTRDGEDIAGNLVREDTEQVILRDATAKEVSVAKRNIASRKMGGSLMPAGLLDFITPQERLDLYAFLSRLGKPGEYDATKQNVARVWRLNTKVGTVNADEMLKSDLRGKDWFPVYATVGGTLPRSDVMAELDGKDTTVWLADSKPPKPGRPDSKSAARRVRKPGLMANRLVATATSPSICPPARTRSSSKSRRATSRRA